ncbi:MAG TPA: UDP-2,3-diacylglucosamine diphosphatase, partial [Paenalcaligenes sp.]|nr:UDP-2,3-diacylglucosamine diphosphatase [Paenalcaligenes sp.]
AHGDQFCTDDKAYQRYRRAVHQPWLQRLFLCLPLKLREKIAASLRQQSKQRNYAVLGDIYEPDTADLLTEHGQTLLIHGHTHQPAIHHFGAQQAHTRVVIPDWEYDHSQPQRGGWISIESNGKVGLHLKGQPTRYL